MGISTATAAPSPQRPANSWDLLKCVALVFMLLDHAGSFLWTQEPWLRALGRCAMPLFLFLVGYSASRRVGRDLWAWGIALSALDMVMSGTWRPLNILLTIAAVRLLLRWIETRDLSRALPVLWVLPLLVAYLPSAFVFQYGSHALMFALLGLVVRRSDIFSALQARLYAIGSFAAYALVEILGGRHYATADIALMLIALGLAGTALCRFRVVPLAAHGQHSAAGKAIAFTGRHTLLIYALHYGGLLLASPHN